MAIRVGEVAPNFVALSTAGEIELAQWLATRRALLAFCPRSAERVNADLLHALAVLAQTIQGDQTAIVAVCAGSIREQLQRIDDLRALHAPPFEFPLVADPECTIARAYGFEPGSGACVVEIASDRTIVGIHRFDVHMPAVALVARVRALSSDRAV